MANVQLSFNLRVSPNVKTVHLLGSWDQYSGHLPLTKDKTSTKSTSWKGNFRFQNNILEPGNRYWYYYIIDGYHVLHNPSESSVIEPTTGQELNVLDVPEAKLPHSSHRSSKTTSSSSSTHKQTSSSQRHSKDKKHSSHSEIPKARPLSMSQIKCPKPQSPHATRNILTADFDFAELSKKFADTTLDEGGYSDALVYDGSYEEASGYFITDHSATSGSSSPVSPTDSDLSYSSDEGSFFSRGTRSNMSGYSTPDSDYSSCTCERYGITRKGDRIRIDCGGIRCGYDHDCSSSDEDFD
ncbi:MAG: hypothetical protein SEPTF4163_004838 [Sporothrix epigloea]